MSQQYEYMGKMIWPGEELGTYQDVIFDQMKDHFDRNEMEEYDYKLTILFSGDHVDVDLAKRCCDYIGRSR